MAKITQKSRRQKYIRCGGTSIVEAAFVLVILILMTLGIMGISLVFLRAQQVTNAARHGARIAIRANSDATDVVQAVKDSLDLVGLTTYDLLPIIPGVNPEVGEAVTVTVVGKDLDFLNLNNLSMLKLAMPDTYKASVTMSKEGP